MKNHAKKTLLAILPAIVILFSASAQTNVSGGIFANTTWSAANSPYIITSSVVVYPGIVLTIQPGVTVKFADGQVLEIRQAQLISTGTSVAPITFTSNSGSPAAGIYSGIYLNGVNVSHTFDYCNFTYADYAIRTNSSSSLSITNSSFISNNTGVSAGPATSVTIDNSLFRFNANNGIYITGGSVSNSRIVQNGTGLDLLGNPATVTNCVVDSNSTGVNNAYATFSHCSFSHNVMGLYYGGMTLDSCTVNYNQTGIGTLIGSTVKNSVIDFNTSVGVNIIWSGATIRNCEIKNNATGIADYREGNLSYPHNTITNNIIENDSIGILLAMHGENVYCNKICNNTAYGIKYTDPQNTSVANNYWCTPDSASTEAVIYDAHDNIGSGILTIMPLDTVQCYLNNPTATGIINYGAGNFSFNIFPNPATTNLTITLPDTVSNAEIRIFNMVGELEYASTTIKSITQIDVTNFESGMHIVQLTMGNSVARQKFIKQ
ncbi:MAG TPA: right-handed parallel beta-helix repeat-containing protein [Bacteroidia bacterium]|nr:right-handed parallel beta-helix repeat-containing protein [Bacteroidia bacterium]